MSIIGKRLVVTNADFNDVAINKEIVTRTITVNITDGTYSGAQTISEGTTATVTLLANSGYKLPNEIVVTAADYTYNKHTGAVVLSNPSEDITITAVCEETVTYTVSTSITNGTYSGDNIITDGGTAQVTVVPGENYQLPTSITVSGASYTYTKATGIVSLFNPTGNVTITVVCEEYDPTEVKLVQGYWSSGAKVLDNRVCNETLVQGVETITTNPGYVIRAVYAYDRELTFPQESCSAYYAISGGMEAETSTSRTTYTTLNNNYWYGVTFAKTDASASILPTEDIVASWVRNDTYVITCNVTGGSASGDATIKEGETATVTITPLPDYNLPNDVTVTGATYEYNSTTGVIDLSNPTGPVEITVTCEGTPSEIPALAQGYWSDGNSLGAMPNRVCNETLIYGIQTVQTNPGYVIRAVYPYSSEHTWTPEGSIKWGDMGSIEAPTSTDRTTWTTLQANKWYGFTFTKTDPNANISPEEDIIAAWVK